MRLRSSCRLELPHDQYLRRHPRAHEECENAVRASGHNGVDAQGGDRTRDGGSDIARPACSALGGQPAHEQSAREHAPAVEWVRGEEVEAQQRHLTFRSAPRKAARPIPSALRSGRGASAGEAGNVGAAAESARTCITTPPANQLQRRLSQPAMSRSCTLAPPQASCSSSRKPAIGTCVAGPARATLSLAAWPAPFVSHSARPPRGQRVIRRQLPPTWRAIAVRRGGARSRA